MTTTEAQRSGAPARVLSDVNRSLTTSSFHDLNNSGAQPVIAQYSTTSSLGGMPSIVVVSPDRIFEGRAIEHQWVLQGHRIQIVGELPEPAPLIDTASDTQWFRDALGLSMAEIAAVFGVTRKAVYDWLDGARTNKAGYIKAVRGLIETELSPDLQPYLRQFWQHGAGAGVSLLEQLKSGEPAGLATDATAALRLLRQPISDYRERVRSEHASATVPHAHNYDEYRNL